MASSAETHDDVEREDAHVTVGFDTRFDLCSIHTDGYGFLSLTTDGTTDSTYHGGDKMIFDEDFTREPFSFLTTPDQTPSL